MYFELPSGMHIYFDDTWYKECLFGNMPLLRFEEYRWPPLPTRDEAAARAHKILFGEEM